MSKNSLHSIPGFGQASVRDLNSLGIYELTDLRDKNPEVLYAALEEVYRSHVDRCVLYGFREAVYFAEGGRNPEKLKWWNWKDKDKSGIKNHVCKYRVPKSLKAFAAKKLRIAKAQGSRTGNLLK